MWFEHTGLPWVLPSPNMPTVDTALVYPGMCLVEGTELSEGRGTTRPFELAGAPHIDGQRLAAALAAMDLPGVRFRPAVFTPGFQKHARTACGGVQLHVTNAETFRPYRTGVAVLKATHDLRSRALCVAQQGVRVRRPDPRDRSARRQRGAAQRDRGGRVARRPVAALAARRGRVLRGARRVPVVRMTRGRAVRRQLQPAACRAPARRALRAGDLRGRRAVVRADLGPPVRQGPRRVRGSDRDVRARGRPARAACAGQPRRGGARAPARVRGEPHASSWSSSWPPTIRLLDFAS